MILEIHLLQSFPPANLNRDDNGMPKSCSFGGRTRARISSQCQKRATRLDYQESTTLDPAHFAKRSRAWMPELKEGLIALDIPADSAEIAAKLALKHLGAEIDDGKIESKTILFLGTTEIEAIAKIVANHWADIEPEIGKKTPALPKEVTKSIEKTLKGNGKPGDVALFGRMMAALPIVNVDASVQMAHAIGVNALEQEFDFFTAVDDLSASDDAGADHIGETGYNSSTFYRFADVDVEQLRHNLGTEVDTTPVLNAFAESFVRAVPSGHQNGFAAHTRPSLALMVVRSGQPISLVDAFERPVRPRREDGLLARSVERLANHWDDLKSLYGDEDIKYVGVATLNSLSEHLSHLKGSRKDSIKTLIDEAIHAATETDAEEA